MMNHQKWRQGLAGVGLLSAAAHGVAFDQAEIERGEYLTRVGDCVACHTAPDGEPFAGGFAVDSPFGDIYSSNITPDTQTGIGNYTRDEFAAALRDGVRADGKKLYPAMPYPDYARITDDDIDALYAYFMEGIEPVSHQPERTELSFPFNQRWGIGVWSWLFASAEPFTPDEALSDELNRGAYLVQGLGHCGSCHTRRGLFFQEKSLTGNDQDFLAGETLAGWYAPSLRGDGEGDSPLQRWSEDDIVMFLATGRNDYSAVVGEMSLVVEHSTSRLEEDDLYAIANYLKSLPAAQAEESSDRERAAEATQDMLTRAEVNDDTGARLYLDNCNACHFSDGQGAPQVFPSLVGNSLVNAEDPTGMLRVILSGARLPSTEKRPAALAMPDFAWRLSDEEVADVANFVRHAWGNEGGEISASQVADVREELPDERVTSAPAYID